MPQPMDSDNMIRSIDEARYDGGVIEVRAIWNGD